MSYDAIESFTDWSFFWIAVLLQKDSICSAAASHNVNTFQEVGKE
ncbi:hypothetical protein [Paenibacillus polymyxa]|nr:hypothetical protein [Paenibacillus polymyxa]